MLRFIQEQTIGNNPKHAAMVQQKVARRLLKQHPLQRLESPSRGSSALLHILGLSSFAYSYSLLLSTDNQMYVESQKREQRHWSRSVLRPESEHHLTCGSSQQ
jgi:hypothetical protein